MNCVSQAWLAHEKELRHFLTSRVNDKAQAEDLLQDVFIKALAEGSRFCELNSSKAWLFRVAKNQLIDYQRTHKQHDEIPEQLEEKIHKEQPVANLSVCLPTALKQLHDKDKDIIQCCDLDGMSQREYAELKNLSLTNVKSRIQRARQRLKNALQISCGIIFDDKGNVCCFESNKKNNN